ncbi:MAG: hypothetical protein K2Y10_11955 [Burkholderiaceae bacterium]|nr:hypothetical protein [Burkholderiaceae bacterium]
MATTTLRKWESRYGFPLAQRTSARTRLYAPATVDQLRLALIRMAPGEKPGVVLRTPFTEHLCAVPMLSVDAARTHLTHAAAATPCVPVAGRWWRCRFAACATKDPNIYLLHRHCIGISSRVCTGVVPLNQESAL